MSDGPPRDGSPSDGPSSDGPSSPGPSGTGRPLVVLETGGGARPLLAGDLPFSLGGEGADARLPGAGTALVWLAVHDGELFVQPAGGPRVTVNGLPLAASRWLRAGDEIALGDARLTFEESASGEDGVGAPRLRLGGASAHRPEPAAAPAGREPGPSAAPGGEDDAAAVRPAAFTPRLGAPARRRRRLGPWLRRAGLALAVLVVAAVALYAFTARAVTVVVEPPPDRLEIRGGLVPPAVGGVRLLLPGSYELVAERAGHRPLAAPFEVGEASRQEVRFALEPLPGRLRLETVPEVEGAAVSVDGEPLGETPLADPLELAAGEHAVAVEADGFAPWSSLVEVAGAGREQVVRAELTRNRGTLTVTSRPAGATVLVDGRVLGTAPLTAEVPAGRHRLEVRLAGYREHRAALEVEPGGEVVVPPVELVPAEAVLTVESDPAGAAVVVGGAFRGETPLELALEPGAEHEIALSRAGHDSARRVVELAGGERRTLSVALEPRLGTVRLTSDPPGAEIVVDGEPTGESADAGGAELELTAEEHEIELRLAGHAPYRATVTPQPGLVREIAAELEPLVAEPAADAPEETRAAAGHELVLVRPGRLTLGAPRREPGRRANEALREVELTRPFYVGVHEVSNRQFREFRPGHLSGAVGSVNLEIDHHPVVRVTWEDAAQYCNWLSEREGLAPFYVAAGASWRAPDPAGPGYRLPTEAEWAWIARAPTGPPPRKYPWGDELPIPDGAGNWADAAVAAVLGRALPGYRDGFAGTAPVDGLAPNPLGLHHLGGNVAEWVHDRYAPIPGPEGAGRNPMGPEEGAHHVIRGASWMSADVTRLRLSYRDFGEEGRPDVGFRVARNAGE